MPKAPVCKYLFAVRFTPGAACKSTCHETGLPVGSIPLDTSEQVFCEFGKTLGFALKTMPDGEVGPRKHWISRIHYQVLAGHPELETIRYPAPGNGVERRNPRNASDSYLFKMRDGVERVCFGDPGWRIGYARDHRTSGLEEF